MEEDVTAVLLTSPYIDISYADQVELKKIIIDRYTELSKGKDIMLVEGSQDYKTGSRYQRFQCGGNVESQSFNGGKIQ